MRNRKQIFSYQNQKNCKGKIFKLVGFRFEKKCPKHEKSENKRAKSRFGCKICIFFQKLCGCAGGGVYFSYSQNMHKEVFFN